MPAPIDFYFDFASPYGYLAAHRIDAIADRHERTVTWRPHLLGVVFKDTGGRPVLDIPLKGDYARHDLARAARLMGVPVTVPKRFPFMSVAAARAFYWLADRDEAAAKTLALALFSAAFAAGRDISGAETVAEIAAGLGQDKTVVLAALGDTAVKQRLRREVDAALARGVFGSPYIIVDNEPFWGIDHLDLLDKWLETGGW